MDRLLQIHLGWVVEAVFVLMTMWVKVARFFWRDEGYAVARVPLEDATVMKLSKKDELPWIRPWVMDLLVMVFRSHQLQPTNFEETRGNFPDSVMDEG